MNCEKFTRNQSTNILVHCNRSDPNRTYKNQRIDHSKTHLNYNLAPEHKDMTDYEKPGALGTSGFLLFEIARIPSGCVMMMLL